MGLVRLNGANGRSLRKPCQEVTNAKEQIEPYIEEAYAIMARERAIGVAAPQIGVPYRWFVSPTQGLVANPVLSNLEEKVSIIEGCLSLPDKWFECDRYKKLQIDYLEVDLTPVTKHLEGYDAFVAQHEIDHLNGCLISDHGSRKYAGE
jgi:peptide deformylase